MRVLVNGLGCTIAGSRVILDNILNSAPDHVDIVAIVPVGTGAAPFNYSPRIKLVRLSHNIWGKYLRVFFEGFLNIVMLSRRFDLMLNLSNYGLCLTDRQRLYIHNQQLLDMAAERKIGGGNPNKLKRWMLNTSLRRCEKVFVQTDHVYKLLQEYCVLNNVSFPKEAYVLKTPFPDFDIDVTPAARKFDFQFFYPVSPFPHKRADLAIGGVNEARKSDQRYGLVITTNGTSTPGIDQIGMITSKEVSSQFRSADALLFTSERETLGLPLLEALFYGKPAVLPSRDYAKEIYGDAAVFYVNENEEGIAKAIEQLRENYELYAERTKQRRESELRIRISWPYHWAAFLAS